MPSDSSKPENDRGTESADTARPREDDLAKDFEDRDDDVSSFDAIAAAAELDAILAGQGGGSDGTRLGQSGAYADKLEAEIDELNGIIADRDSELEAQRGELHSAIARVEREAEKQGEQRVRAILVSFLDVLDDLDRAVDAARREHAGESLIAGIELVRKSFLNKLKSFGVTQKPALGEVFDPAFHDAVSIVAADPDKNGIIVNVVREGYAIGDEVLRPASVVIGRRSE